MKIIEKFKAKKPVISFEIFPPKIDTPLETIYEKLDAFKKLQPDYISVTYGAGGSRKHHTIEIASKIKNEYHIESMAHFTCVGHSKEEIDNMLISLKENNVENILALRGDPPQNQPDFDFNKNIYKYAYQLIEHIKNRGDDFCLSAAAYVEGHISSKRLKDDLANLKLKVDIGVDFLVTQLFFENKFFYDFLDKAEATGIKCPIMAGIMPIFKAEQVLKMAAMGGTSIPAKVVLMIDKYKNNPDDIQKAGIEYAANQIKELVDNGIAGIHLYTMNRPKSSKIILEGANIR